MSRRGRAMERTDVSKAQTEGSGADASKADPSRAGASRAGLSRPDASKGQLVTIMLVEDDPGHAFLVEENLRRGGITNEFVKLTDGKQALEFLYQRGEFAGQRRPSRLLMLLDLNMPNVDGLEVLETIKSDPKMRSIPVIILTSTDDQREIDECYKLGCNVYISKPVDYEAFCSAIRHLGLFIGVIAMPSPA